MTWQVPTECDLCPHPITEHRLWEPDTICDGWMQCEHEECAKVCWHDWPALEEEGREFSYRNLAARFGLSSLGCLIVAAALLVAILGVVTVIALLSGQDWPDLHGG